MRFTKVAAFLGRQASLAMFSEPTLTQKAPNSHKRAASAPCARDAWCSGLGGRRILDSLQKYSFLVPSPIFLRIRAYANGSPVCSWASQAAGLRRPKRVEGLLEHMLPSRSGGIAGPGTVLTIGFRESLRAFLSRRSSKPAGRVAPDNQIPTTSLADPLQVEESHSVFGSMHSHSPLKAALAVSIGSLQTIVPARISA
jgi:hypothetical protein